MTETVPESKQARLWPWIILSLVGLLGLSAILQDEGAPPPPAITLDAAEIRINGSLSHSTIEAGATLVAWISLSNLGQADISNIRLSGINQPGLELTGIRGCGQSVTATTGPPVSLRQKPSPLIPFNCSLNLKPGQTITIRAELRGTGASPTEIVFPELEWTGATGAVSEAAVSLGELAITDHKDWALAVVRKSIELAKDLALPIVLALFGYYFQKRERELADQKKTDEAAREAKEKQERDAAEDRRRMDQERRTQVAQTWNKMLPRSHDLMITYYMHLAAASDLAASGIENSRRIDPTHDKVSSDSMERQGEETARVAFYYVSIFDCRVRHTAQSIGGFHFKSRLGEILASQCLREYRRLYPGVAENLLSDTSVVTNLLKPFDSRETFLRKLDGKDKLPGDAHEVMARHFKYFKSWLETTPSARTVVCLRALVAVVEYEMNRPYLYWYDEPEKLRLTEETEKFLKEVAATIQEQRKIPDFVSQTSDWLTAGKAGAS